MARARNQQEKSNFDEKVVQVSRVSKKTKGGNQIGFSVLMVVGDHQGRVGVGLGKAPDVLSAIKKGVRKAKKRMFTVPMDGSTIPFPLEINEGAASIVLKPAPRGTGVIAGGAVRAVVEAAGIRDISSKILGTDNKASNVYATFAALRKIRQIVDKKGIVLKSIAEEEKEEKEKEREQQRLAQQKAEQEEKQKKQETKKKSTQKPKKAKAAKETKKESKKQTKKEVAKDSDKKADSQKADKKSASVSKKDAKQESVTKKDSDSKQSKKDTKAPKSSADKKTKQEEDSKKK